MSLIHFSKYVLDVWLCNTNINNPGLKKIRMWGAELIIELIFNKWIAVQHYKADTLGAQKRGMAIPKQWKMRSQTVSYRR